MCGRRAGELVLLLGGEEVCALSRCGLLQLSFFLIPYKYVPACDVRASGSAEASSKRDASGGWLDPARVAGGVGDVGESRDRPGPRLRPRLGASRQNGGHPNLANTARPPQPVRSCPTRAQAGQLNPLRPPSTQHSKSYTPPLHVEPPVPPLAPLGPAPVGAPDTPSGPAAACPAHLHPRRCRQAGRADGGEGRDWVGGGAGRADMGRVEG